MAKWVLKFISGKYQGGEFPLEEGGEYTIGRSNDSSLVLVEDMVSRNHAKLVVRDGLTHLIDNRSTNGSFVNGERVDEAVLKEGDRILFGTSIIKLVRVEESHVPADPESTWEPSGSSPKLVPGPATADPQYRKPAPATQAISLSHPLRPPSVSPESTSPPVDTDRTPDPAPEPAPKPAQQASPAQSRATISGGIAGMLEEVGLPDLLQLFSASRKSGVLRIESEKNALIYLREGRLVYAEIEDQPNLPPEKAAYRVLTFNTGTFVLEPPSDREFDETIEMSTEAIMMEAMRLMDEMDNIKDDLPATTARIGIKIPLVPPLRSLTPEILDTLQLVINHRTVQTVLNTSLGTDLETMQDIGYLIKHNYVEILSE